MQATPSTSTHSSASTSCGAHDAPICIGQRVRFDVECVLIPDPSPVSRLPRLITKSYTVPLWRRRNQDLSPASDSEADTREEDHVFLLKVPVPSITIKSRSPTRLNQPLVPCIVNHDPASPPPPPGLHRHRAARQTSLSPRLHSHVITVPLRSCCPDCVAPTEDSLRLGDSWQERFTRAARRRRSSSADSRDNVSPRRRLVDAMPGFDSIIAVDEVDKISRSRRAETDPEPPAANEETLPPSFSRKGTPRTAFSGAHVVCATHAVRHSEPDLEPSPVDDSEQEQDEDPFSHRADAIALPDFDFGQDMFGVDDLVLVNLVRPVRILRGTRASLSNDGRPPPPTLLHSRQRSMPLLSSRPAAPPYMSSELPGPPPMDYSRSPPSHWKRPHITLPGPAAFLKVSAEFIKGISMSAGTPMSL
ncbi:hypothetical protein IEO21_04930 [Rhodonia placenta]|uniref:Uncharacterized protein n=1 Tax=Rhodonia placenta TaxID=104341 RepID=A0A8H7P2Z3_9APHY|nr:hypothetical protein IEO21_04930 [Postia placenta]